MSSLRLEHTPIRDLVVIAPPVFDDERGYFFESYNARILCEIGIAQNFVQDNESRSKRGVLRGLHMQKERPQAKLVRVVEGEIFDVAVDARPESSTFGEWYGIFLSGENKKQLYIPEGFLHGFLTLSDEAIFAYKCSDYYAPHDECGVRFDDSDIGISWPFDISGEPIISPKDMKNTSFEEFSVECREK